MVKQNTSHTAKDILKTEKILKFECEQTISQVLPKLTSSHDAAFVFDQGKLVGVVSPYFLIRSRSIKEHSKLKNIAKMPPKLKLDSSFSEIAKAMINSKIHYLPVFDDNDEFIGIATIRRLLQYIVKNNLFNGNGHIIFRNRPLITAKEDVTISQITALIKKEKVAKIPIVNENNHIVGIISQYDIRDTIGDQNSSGRLDKHGEKNTNGQDLVKDYMKKMVVTVKRIPDFYKAVNTMENKKVGSLLIVDKDNRPNAIVSKKDLLQTVVASKL